MAQAGCWELTSAAPGPAMGGTGRLSGADLSCSWPRLTCVETRAAWRIWGFVCWRDEHDPIFLPLLGTYFDDSERTQTPDLYSCPQCPAVMQSSKDGQWLCWAGKNKHISLVTRSSDFGPCNFISSMVTSKGVPAIGCCDRLGYPG